MAAAVLSARAQLDVVVEVIVVDDGTGPGDGVEQGIADRWCTTGGGRGASAARRRGTELATAPWVAYLDDDDTWRPDKLRRQLALAGPVDQPQVISCQIVSTRGHRRVVAPRTPYAEGDLARYLFHRRRLNASRNLLHTSTLLVPRWVAGSPGWTVGLARHHDWDFVLRTVHATGARVRQVEEALVEVEVHPGASISSGDSWETSLRWAQEMGDRWPPDVFVDFVVGQPLRYAIQARDVDGVRQALGAARRARRLPSARATVLGASGALSRRSLVSLMHATREVGRPRPPAIAEEAPWSG